MKQIFLVSPEIYVLPLFGNKSTVPLFSVFDNKSTITVRG